LFPQLSRFSAACGLLSGLLIGVPGAVSVFTGKTAAAAFFIALSPALALPLLVAVYQRHAHVPGRLGPVAYGTNLVGLGLFGGAVFTVDTTLVYLDTSVLHHLKHGPTIVALLGSAVLFAAGCVLFGVFLLRTRAYPRALPWAYLLFPSLLALLSPLPDSVLKNVIHVLAGGTLVWLAATLWRAVPNHADAVDAGRTAVGAKGTGRQQPEPVR
jgi:hypothetical protein